MTDIINKYKLSSFIPFSLTISEDKATGKKKLSNLPSHSTIKKYSNSNIDKRKNGLAIRTGTAYKDKYIIAVDIDNKPDDKLYLNGYQKWKELINKHYTIDNRDKDNIINIDTIENFNNDMAEQAEHEKEFIFLQTPTQKTGNNGYHYLFLVDEEQLNIIGSSLTGLIIDNSYKSYSIDIKATNQFLLVEPSKYNNKCYKWIRAPHDTAILSLPEWLMTIIINTNAPAPKKDKVIHKKQETINTTPQADDKLDILQCLSSSRYNNYNEWVLLGRILKNAGISYEYFLTESKKSPLYQTDNYIYDKWASFKNAGTYKINSLYYLAKQDDPKLFNKIVSETYRQNNISQLFNIDNFEQIKINKKYLLDGTSTDKIIFDTIDKWQTTETQKTLNVKSCYGSGKTQLIKEILKKYEPKRVLWVSYRQTLTDNIEDEFIKFGFKSYLGRVYDADRQIIQLESIKHLKNDVILDDDEARPIPYYNLVIVDEVESVLNHFNSKTFKGNNENIYNDLYYILENADKIITLDGDLNQRALNYVSNFGQMTIINNEYNVNEREFNFISDEELFLTKLIHDIREAKKENKKIALCSMSKSETIKYNNLILEQEPDLKILLINADSDDEDKKQLKHIQTNILNYDVFIYSPSIEAGVNIDIKGIFNKLYCVVCGGSTSPRAFLQMTARIRHLNDNSINILNNTLKINDCRNFWTFDETLNLLELTTEKTGKIKTISRNSNNKLIETFKQSPYSNTYTFNKMEQLNNNTFYFMKLLLLYCERKGIKIIMNEDQEPSKIKFDKVEYLEKIISSDNIDETEEQEIENKVKSRTATRHEKLKLIKQYYLKCLGVERLSSDILNTYYGRTDSIYTFINLIDDTKLKEKAKTNSYNTQFYKLQLIKQMIKDIGYKNCFDNVKITSENFGEALRTLINNNVYFSIETRGLFNMAKFKTDTSTTKAIMGHINCLLKYASLKITSTREREGTIFKNYYILERLNNIEEIIYYKMQNGEDIQDKDNYIKCNKKEFIYNELFETVEINKTKKLLDETTTEKLKLIELDMTDY